MSMEILCEHNWKNQPSSQNQTNKIFIYYQTCEKKRVTMSNPRAQFDNKYV